MSTDNVITGNVEVDEDTLMELQAQLGTYRNHAIGYHEGELGDKARMAWEYYYGNLPEAVTKGSSKWVDRSVWESVNGTLQELVSVFTSGEDAVKFAPTHTGDADAANAATKMVNKILLRDNEGYNVLHDAFKECLITRNSFIKRYWKTDVQTFSESFDDLTKDELDILLENIQGDILEFSAEEVVAVEIKDGKEEPTELEDKVQELDDNNDKPEDKPHPPEESGADGAMPPKAPSTPQAPQNAPQGPKQPGKGAIPMGGGKGAIEAPKGSEFDNHSEVKYFGYVVYEVVSEGVKVEYVPFEEVIIEPTARSIKDSNYIGHRTRQSKDDLLNMGFDPEVVESLNSGSSDIEAGVISNVRVNNLNPLNVSDVVSTGDERADKIWLHENYLKTSLVSGRLEILQIFTVNDEILEINRVNEFPFETMTPFPIPGSVWGESVFDITKDVQDLNTTLIRGIIDNIMNANFRRYTAIKGQYDRESLLNNRPGAVVEQLSQGAVAPMPYHQLPTGVDSLLQYINSKKEERTGVSKVGQGLDPNVFKNDNAQGTVQMVMSAAQNRLRMVARNIAQRGVMELMGSIYNLVRQNGKKPVTVETANGMVVLDPSKLPPRNQLVVSVAVGDGERKERAASLQSLMMAMQNPAMNQFIQPNNAYYLATQMFESMGIFDTENYLTPLDKIPAPQPDPVQQLTIQQMQEQIKQLGVQTQKIVSSVTTENQKAEFEQQRAADEMQLKIQKSKSDEALKADEMSLKERELQIEERKLELEAQKLELKRQEMLLEAQIEARQGRPVAIGTTGGKH